MVVSKHVFRIVFGSPKKKTQKDDYFVYVFFSDLNEKSFLDMNLISQISFRPVEFSKLQRSVNATHLIDAFL